MTATPITYQYKVFRSGRYLGDLPNVSSPFQYALDINNGAAPLSITCQIPVYNANLAPDLIQTEVGDPIETETGESFEMERQPDQFGANNSGLLLANDNDVIVWEFSPEYPNGKKVYSGWITKYKVNYRTGLAQVNVISYGMDLNDYLVIGDASVDQSNTTVNTIQAFSQFFNGNLIPGGFGQTVTPGAGVTNLAGLTVRIKCNEANIIATITVYNNVTDANNGVNPLGSASVSLNNDNTTTDYRVSWATPLTIGSSYFFTVTTNVLADNTYLSYQTSDVYANGSMYTQTYASYPPLPAPTYVLNGVADMYFKSYTTSGNTSPTYTAYDPTNMVKNMIDNYVSYGGKVNYSASSTDLTALSITYGFNTARVLDGIKKALDLSPATFYWTVDPATALLYFKQFSTTPAVLLTLGQNIIDIDVGINAEAVRNIIYFTGGPTAGVNLFRRYTDATGLARTGRQRLESLADNRVTLAGTADQIASGFLAANATEQYEITVTVARNVIDITTLLPGQSVGLSGFGNFLDRPVFYIVRIERYSDKVVLLLGTIPPRATSVLKEIQNNIQDLNTLANPSVPS